MTHTKRGVVACVFDTSDLVSFEGAWWMVADHANPEHRYDLDSIYRPADTCHAPPLTQSGHSFQLDSDSKLIAEISLCDNRVTSKKRFYQLAADNRVRRRFHPPQSACAEQIHQKPSEVWSRTDFLSISQYMEPLSFPISRAHTVVQNRQIPAAIANLIQAEVVEGAARNQRVPSTRLSKRGAGRPCR